MSTLPGKIQTCDIGQEKGRNLKDANLPDRIKRKEPMPYGFY
jgi:hypothetical protein